jgi:chorismate mutase / prephenate dehydratase
MIFSIQKSLQIMKEIRNQINNIDDEIIRLLADRRKLSLEIIKLKNEEKSSIRDKDREKELLSHIIEIGKKYGMDSHYISKIFRAIIDDSIILQNKFILEKEKRNNG